MMKLEQYLDFIQQATHPEVYPNDLAFYYELGWQGELGEIRQLLSKALRQVRSDQPLPDEFWEKLVDELGDVLFYQCGFWLHRYGCVTEGAAWQDWEQNAETLKRSYKIQTLESVINGQIPEDSVILLPEGYSLADLATRNHNKLMQRKAETGVFAKPI